MAPTIIGVGKDATISITPETKSSTATTEIHRLVLAFLFLKDLPFWIWSKEDHRQQAVATNGKCCIQHVLDLPIKNGKPFPIFDFQKQIFDYLEEYQNIWIKKARGIRVTTFLIRYLVWKILYSNELDGKSIFIISGTREEFAQLCQLFERIEKNPNSKYKKLFLGYELGLGKIYDPEYIAQKKLEPEFEREYNLKYLGKIGNVFSPSQIDKAIQLGEQYQRDTN